MASIKLVGVACILAVTLLNTEVWAKPTQEADSLNKYFTRLHAHYRQSQKSEFVDMPSFDDLNGKPFRVEVGFKGYAMSHGSPPKDCFRYYDYEDGELVFDFWGISPSLEPYACVKYSQKLKGSYRGSNAFGVSGTVLSYQAQVGNISSASFRRLIKYNLRIPTNSQMAKSLVSDVIFVFEGTLLSPGHCDSEYIEPTIDSPEEYSINICEVNVSISRVSYQRKSTGEILMEWPEVHD